MELTGKIELDEKTMQTLRDEIRKEVIQDISKTGLMLDETVKYLENICSTSYFNIFRDTIEKAISAGEKEKENDEFHFDDEKKFRILKLMYEMIRLSGIC